jgi:hypothetical protein
MGGARTARARRASTRRKLDAFFAACADFDAWHQAAEADAKNVLPFGDGDRPRPTRRSPPCARRSTTTSAAAASPRSTRARSRRSTASRRPTSPPPRRTSRSPPTRSRTSRWRWSRPTSRCRSARASTRPGPGRRGVPRRPAARTRHAHRGRLGALVAKFEAHAGGSASKAGARSRSSASSACARSSPARRRPRCSRRSTTTSPSPASRRDGARREARAAAPRPRALLNNYVSFTDFYARRGAIFQAGTLYLDGRACDMCFHVERRGKHGAMAPRCRTRTSPTSTARGPAARR